jgi:hypothetical protein
MRKKARGGRSLLTFLARARYIFLLERRGAPFVRPVLSQIKRSRFRCNILCKISEREDKSCTKMAFVTESKIFRCKIIYT